MIKAFFILTTVSVQLSWAAINAPLTFQEALYPGSMVGVNRTADPVSVGVPLPDNATNGTSDVHQLTLSGASAAQFRVLGRWPSGRIKWVLVDTEVDLSAGHLNKSTTLTDGGTGNFGGPDLAADNGSTIAVSTGSAMFTIRKSHFNVLDQVVTGGATVVASGASQGLVITGPAPGGTTCPCITTYSSVNDPNSTAVIEENGPVKAVIKASGDHVDAAGNVYMHFTVRMYFYKGKSYVKLTSILRNADYGTSNTFATAFKGHQGYEVRITPNLSGPVTYAIATDRSPAEGALSASDSVFLYQGASNLMAASGCPSFHDPNGRCVLATNDQGYTIAKNGSTIASGSNTQFPQGWADLSDANGAGVEIGSYQIAAYGSKSLEFNNGGSDVRIGIWARQNSQPYYQAWPQYSINDVYLIFHGASLVSPSDEFLKLQHYLVGHADRTQYNNAGVFFYPLIDPGEEDSFYTSIAKEAVPPLSTSATCCVQDQGVLRMGRWPLVAWKYYGWEGGGGGNQMEFHLSRLFNFIRRGYTGGFLDTAQFYKFVAETGFPRSDGFNWRDRSRAELDSLGAPTAASVNSKLATRDWPASLEHTHVYGIPDYYFMTGDETIKDAILNGLADRYLNTTTSAIANGRIGTERGIGGTLMNSVRLSQFMQAVGDSNAGAMLAQAQTVYAKQIKPELCVSGYPVGCSVQNSTGISRTRGMEYAFSATMTQTGCGSAGAGVRGTGPFQASLFLQGLWELHQASGPEWPEYGPSLDLAYAYSSWSLTEAYVDDGTGRWSPNNGFRHYVALDVPNACDTFYYPVRPEQTVWFNFLIQHAYTGSADWGQKFKMALQRTASAGANDEFGYYTIAAVIDRLERPGNMVLVNVPVTVAVNGSGGYTLSWSVPAGAMSYRIKYGGKKIVEWIGFDPGKNVWVGDPASTMPWFAAAEAASPPLPLAPGATQQFTLSGLPPNQFFAIKAYVNSAGGTNTTPPSVTINAPVNGATISGTVLVSAGVSDNSGIGNIQFQVDGSNLGNPVTGPGPYSIAWNTSGAPNGAHTISAVAKDVAGISAASTPVTVTVNNGTPSDTTPPVVSITSPASGASVNGTVAIAVNASDNVGIASVQIKVDGANFGNLLDGPGPYTTSWNTAQLSNGSHTISAVAVDVAGNAVASSITVSVNNSNPGVPPKISAVAVQSVTSSSATLTWVTSTPADSQVAYGTGTSYGTTTPRLTAQLTAHSVAISGLAASTTYHYQVLSRDAQGNLASSVDATFTTATPSSGSGIVVPVNSWTTFQTNGFPAETVGYDATVYASAIKRHVVLGKYHHYSSEPNYCMDGWSYDENRWDILDCGAYFHTEHSMEGGHPVGAFVYVPSRSSIIYYGGMSGSNQPEMAYHTWWWDVVGRTGRDKISESRPGNIKVSSMAYDQSRDVALFYPDSAHQLETYDPNANQWRTPKVKGTPPPNGLTFPTLEWDSKDQKTYLYGGATGNSCVSQTLTFSSDVYTFDPATNTWARLNIAPDPVEIAAGHTGIPDARWYAGFAYDPVDNIFILAGGQHCNGQNPIGIADTWKFDPAAMQWTKLNPSVNFTLHTPSDAPFQKFKYDPDHNAFVMILQSYNTAANTGGTWGNYPARVWVYCYTACSNVGTVTNTYAVPSASLNRNARPITAANQTWASDTAIAVANDRVYAGWIETGLPFNSSVCMFHHPYVESTTNGTAWSWLGSNCAAMDSNAATVERDAEKLSLAVVDDTLWSSWSEAKAAAAPPDTIFAKHWDGSSWVGGPIGKRNTGNAFQGFSQLLPVGKTPTIAFIENNRNIAPDIREAYVDQYNGTAWVPLGEKLNTTSSSRVESLAIASGDTTPWACWAEEVIKLWTSVSPSQLYCASWNGSSWSRVGSVLNQASGTWASDISMTYAGGRPYVAWTERTTAGNAVLYVKSYDGSQWLLAGTGSVSNNTKTGWSFHPRLVTDGKNVFLAWTEQIDLGQPSRLYVAKWDGNSWSALGGALNIDPINGTAAHSSIAMLNDSPIVLWNEAWVGSLQQTYAKQWDGSQWTMVNVGNGKTATCDLNDDHVVNILDVQIAANQTLGVVPCTNADLQQNGACSIVDVQRIIAASMGATCTIGP